jgi:hypothetical protein
MFQYYTGLGLAFMLCSVCMDPYSGVVQLTSIHEVYIIDCSFVHHLVLLIVRVQGPYMVEALQGQMRGVVSE